MTLKKKEIDGFKQQLEDLRDELTRHVRGTSEEVKNTEGKGYTQHQADEGTDDFDRTISLALSSQEMEIIRQIERALEKIDEGTFGVCDLSGKPIAIKRLEAIPYATMTREAQEQLENGQV